MAYPYDQYGVPQYQTGQSPQFWSTVPMQQQQPYYSSNYPTGATFQGGPALPPMGGGKLGGVPAQSGTMGPGKFGGPNTLGPGSDIIPGGSGQQQAAGGGAIANAMAAKRLAHSQMAAQARDERQSTYANINAHPQEFASWFGKQSPATQQQLLSPGGMNQTPWGNLGAEGRTIAALGRGGINVNSLNQFANSVDAMRGIPTAANQTVWDFTSGGPYYGGSTAAGGGYGTPAQLAGWSGSDAYNTAHPYDASAWGGGGIPNAPTGRLPLSSPSGLGRQPATTTPAPTGTTVGRAPTPVVPTPVGRQPNVPTPVVPGTGVATRVRPV